MSTALPRVRAFAALGLVTLMLLSIASPASSVTDEELEQARLELERAREEQAAAEALRAEAAAERARALSDVDEAVLAYEAVNAEYRELVYRTGLLRSRIDEYEITVARLRDSVRDRAVQAYMFGRDRGDVALFLSSEKAQNAILAKEILAQAVVADAGTVSAFEAATAEMDRLRADLTLDSERVNELRIEAEAIADRMYELLGVADKTVNVADQQVSVAVGDVGDAAGAVQTLEAQRAAEIRAAQEAKARAEAIARAMASDRSKGVPAEITPGFICPVAGPSAFADTWGAPRSDGRTHAGVDMMGALGTPLVAVGDGYITMSFQSLGGSVVWLHADHGVSYFYAHLDSYPGWLVQGQRVARGDVIGYMGDTGNPAPGAYHLHFSIYPGGRAPVNPTPTVARVC